MTDQPQLRVPHLRDGCIVAKVGLVQSTTAPARLHHNEEADAKHK
jgi:hypothetical protein